MTPLHSALLNRHAGGQNAIHRAFGAQVHLLGWRPVHEPLATQGVEDLVAFLLAQGSGGGRVGLPIPGRWPQTKVERGSADPEHIARGPNRYVLGQLLGRLQEISPSSRLNPSSPATFPLNIDDQMRLVELLLEARLLALQLQEPRLQRIAQPRFLDRAFSDPLVAAFRHVVRCDEYRPSRLRSRPTSQASVNRSASSTILRSYDGLNRRRRGLPATSGSAGAAALRLPSPDRRAVPFSFILSRSLSILGFSAFAPAS